MARPARFRVPQPATTPVAGDPGRRGTHVGRSRPVSRLRSVTVGHQQPQQAGRHPARLLESIGDPNNPCPGSGTAVVGPAWDDQTSAASPPTAIRVTHPVRYIAGEHLQSRPLRPRSSAVECNSAVPHNRISLSLTGQRG